MKWWITGLSVIGLILSAAPAAHAVIVAQNDEMAVDLDYLANGLADLTVTYDLRQVIAHARSDQMTGGDTDQEAAQWQAWAERFPMMYSWTKADNFLKAAIPRVVSAGGIDRLAVKVYFTLPDGSNTAQSRLFELFDCSQDCLSGTLPKQQNLSSWAVQQIRAEADRNKAHNR